MLEPERRNTDTTRPFSSNTTRVAPKTSLASRDRTPSPDDAFLHTNLSRTQGDVPFDKRRSLRVTERKVRHENGPQLARERKWQRYRQLQRLAVKTIMWSSGATRGKRERDTRPEFGLRTAQWSGGMRFALQERAPARATRPARLAFNIRCTALHRGTCLSSEKCAREVVHRQTERDCLMLCGASHPHSQ